MSLCSRVAWPHGWMPCARVTSPLLSRVVVAWGCSSPLPFPYILVAGLLNVVVCCSVQLVCCHAEYTTIAKLTRLLRLSLSLHTHRDVATHAPHWQSAITVALHRTFEVRQPEATDSRCGMTTGSVQSLAYGPGSPTESETEPARAPGWQALTQRHAGARVGAKVAVSDGR